MRTPARLLLAAAVAVMPASLSAQLRGGTEPYVLEGIVGKDQNVAREAGWFPVSIGFVGDDKAPERWIGLTSFVTWNGDPFVGREDLRRMLLSDPTLLIAGPPDLVKQLQQAPAGSRVVVRGILNKVSRNFLVSAVKVTAAGKKK
jgi:hypothetical protein